MCRTSLPFIEEEIFLPRGSFCEHLPLKVEISTFTFKSVDHVTGDVKYTVQRKLERTVNTVDNFVGHLVDGSRKNWRSFVVVVGFRGDVDDERFQWNG